MDEQQQHSNAAGELRAFPPAGKHRSLRGAYRRQYWLRIAFQTGVPAVGAALLLTYSIFKDDLAEGPWKVPVFLGVLALAMIIPAVCAWTRHWDELQRRDWNKAMARRGLAIESWKHWTRFYVRLNSVISELLLERSEAHDDLMGNIHQIVALLHRFLVEEYGDPSGHRGLRVAFFEADNVRNGLILRSAFTSDQRLWRSVKMNDTHPRLMRTGDSLASLVWKLGKMVIVSDTAAELHRQHPRFAPLTSEPQDTAAGSIVAYPIVDRRLSDLQLDCTIGVICVDCTQPDVFTPGREQSLEYLFDTFAKRITFEVRRYACRSRGAGSADGEANELVRAAFAAAMGADDECKRKAQTLLRCASATTESLVEHHDRETARLSAAAE